MSTQIISGNPSIDVELAYRSERLLAEAGRERLAHQATLHRAGFLDRFRRRNRRVVAARATHIPRSV